MKTNIVSTLNEKLLQQPFSQNEAAADILSKYQQIANGYSQIENSLAVLSDLKANKSYIYNGGVAETLGIASRGSVRNINSIWEDDIFERIHPDDLIKKHTLELQFFHLIKSMPVNDRSDYYVKSELRMRNAVEQYLTIRHRMFYVSGSTMGDLWLSLCLYDLLNQNSDEIPTGVIVNSATGEIIRTDNNKCNNILSKREVEILSLIEKGKMSKDIAEILSISIYTINRHRQNILEKLRVKNSLEACRVAKFMGLF